MTDLLQQLELGDGIEQPVDQWTLIGVKLVNWGTFSGYNAVPIHADGHMVTGESGSGKSTLLDAISSVIYHPKDLNFNAAAESGSKRDRSDFTYVRGASSRGKNDDGVTTLRFARNGVTWSGIALTLNNPAQRKVTLVKAFRASASCADSSSLAKVSMVFDGEFDPRALAPFMDTKIDLVGIKNKLNPELASTDFKPFQERYLRIFGMKKEVLHLLQKVQSMQGVSSLDKLMQDFVLDDPTTFLDQ